MARRPKVELVCEDFGHEAFARALLLRLSAEAGLPAPELHPRSVRGGHGRAISELRSWQRGLPSGASPCDLLVVLIDGNSEGWAQQRRQVLAAIDQQRFVDAVVAIPDPHVEAWVAADPEALRSITGAAPPAPPARPDRLGLKRWLQQALEDAGQEVLIDPMEISADLVPEMDLFRAGKDCPSLRHTVEELRAALQRMAARR